VRTSATLIQELDRARAFCDSSSEFDVLPDQEAFSFARSVRFGILLPYRDTISLSFPPRPRSPTDRHPLPERFLRGEEPRCADLR